MQIANPVSFLAQKILIHGRRNRQDRAKDILYMHDTIETFAARVNELQLNGRTSGPSFTRTAFALCSAQRHWYLEQSPIRFVPHRESSRAGRCLQKRFERPAVWDLLGFSEKETVKNRLRTCTPQNCMIVAFHSYLPSQLPSESRQSCPQNRHCLS